MAETINLGIVGIKNMGEYNSQTNYEKLNAMSFEDTKAEILRAYADRINMYKTMLENSLKRNKQYAKVRAEVEAWNPPTKEFALKQIDMCVDTQEQIDKYREYANEQLDDSDNAVAKYLCEQMEFHTKSLKRAKESWEAELKRTKDKNEWMEQFLKSL